jgi:hypothetical protein
LPLGRRFGGIDHSVKRHGHLVRRVGHWLRFGGGTYQVHDQLLALLQPHKCRHGKATRYRHTDRNMALQC